MFRNPGLWFVTTFLLAPAVLWGQGFLGFLEATAPPPPKTYAEFERDTAKAGEIVTLTIHVFPATGWYLYSISVSPADGPEPTRIVTSTVSHFAVGVLQETQPEWVEDEAFGMKLPVHRKPFVLTQGFRITEGTKSGVQDWKGELHFQSCNQRICAPLQRLALTAPLEVDRDLDDLPLKCCPSENLEK